MWASLRKQYTSGMIMYAALATGFVSQEAKNAWNFTKIMTTVHVYHSDMFFFSSMNLCQPPCIISAVCGRTACLHGLSWYTSSSSQEKSI